jgi:hypothetical protein
MASDRRVVPTKVPRDHLFYNHDHSVTKAASLLYFVRTMDYQNAIEMVERNPLLLFEMVEIQHADGSQDHLSPLEYVCKTYDVYLCKNFRSLAEKHELLSLFDEALSLPRTYINLNPLIGDKGAYHEFHNTFLRLSSVESDSAKSETAKKEIIKAFLNIGKAQKKYLPQHMLVEFCHQGFDWHTQFKFQTDRLSTLKTKIVRYDVRRLPPKCLVPLGNLSHLLGKELVLVRGASQSNAQALTFQQSLLILEDAYSHDRLMLMLLFQARIEEFQMLLPSHLRNKASSSCKLNKNKKSSNEEDEEYRPIWRIC